MPPAPSYDFPAPILKRQADGHMAYHYLPVPPDIAEQLMKSGTKRVILTLNSKEENRAIHVTRDGEYFLVLGMTVLRNLGTKPGDVVIAELHSDPNPNTIELPPEFEEALEQDPEAAERFYGFTPGKQRSVSMYITQAKRTETRVKRSLEMAHKLRTYTLHGDTPPNSPSTP